jgi:hypothetical protein
VVKRDGEGILAEATDVLTEDASVFWVWLGGGRGRIAVYVHEETWLPEGYRL